ncbi:MAG: hypothetical protein RIB65_20985 [Ilumatobacter fluminis]|uniref:Uncharacterized protein n=1 Tax=Ilumatobacter fluminis TaxID=467091 RepID=A0A4R7HWA3_9ACTN|nr:hypothetical protein [Ilumatobacter fluminis]TDT15357.1 hypothetical protein BDK89_0927 [Ilumatobacter fluminis]
MTQLVVIVLAVAVVAAIIVSVTRYRRSRDGVDSFRRQIDALSPEARRPVVDQVQSAAEANEPPATDEEDDDDGT